MIVAIAYHPGDEDQFARWVAWAAELGVGANHGLICLPFKGLTPPEIRGWKSVELLRDYSGIISDWQNGAAVSDAAAPNHVFRELARHIHEKQLGPWLFMEPDAVFLTSDAVDRIERDYRQSGKRYMGANVQAGDTPRHMSGIAVYPEDLAVTAPNYMQPRHAQFPERLVEVAFNLAGAPDALPEMQATRLIQQETRHPAFTELREAKALIENGRVVFHSDKSHSLITLLSSASGELDSSMSHKHAYAGSIPAPGTISIGSAASNPLPEPASWAGPTAMEICRDKLDAIDARLLRVESALALRQRTEPKHEAHRLVVSPKPAPKPAPKHSRRRLKAHSKRTPEEQAKIDDRMAALRARKGKK